MEWCKICDEIGNDKSNFFLTTFRQDYDLVSPDFFRDFVIFLKDSRDSYDHKTIFPS